MIFLCFSSKDRQSLAESIMFHLTNYAIPVWYDRHRMLLGDDRNQKNFTEGIGMCDYAVIILSPNSMVETCCAREEIDIIKERHKRNDMTVFPIFYNIKASDISSAFSWMKNLVYKELDVSIDSRSTCNHIVCKYLQDELNKYEIKTIGDITLSNHSCDSLRYLKVLMKTYMDVSKSNTDARLSLIYAGCLYMKTHYNIQLLPEFYYRGVERLFCETKLHLSIDLREQLIIEHLFLLLLNALIFGYIL
jgi:hypothetical protein